MCGAVMVGYDLWGVVMVGCVVWGVVMVGYVVWGVVMVGYVVCYVMCCDSRPTVFLAEIRKEKLLEASVIVCQLWPLFL